MTAPCRRNWRGHGQKTVFDLCKNRYKKTRTGGGINKEDQRTDNTKGPPTIAFDGAVMPISWLFVTGIYRLTTGIERRGNTMHTRARHAIEFISNKYREKRD